LKVTQVRFLGAAARPGGGPRADLPEVAIGGRSNVGKSSLINTLLGRRGVARTSSTPGRTRQLNFFAVNERFVLVDLPGYGFAVGSEAERRAWGPLVETYLGARPTLRGVVMLVDLRRGLQPDDEQLLDYLRAHRLPHAVVATKVDKLARAAAGRAMQGLRAGVGEAGVVAFSARTGDGRDELWRVIRRWLDDVPPGEARP
jgi:GTP-binding protein